MKGLENVGNIKAGESAGGGGRSMSQYGSPKQVVDVLTNLSTENSRTVSETLVETWKAAGSQRERLPELAALLDAQESWETERRSLIRDGLLLLAVDAEIEGNAQKSAALDHLRRLAGQAELPKWPLVTATDVLDSAKEFRKAQRRRKELTANYHGRGDEELKLLLLDAEPLKRSVELDVAPSPQWQRS